MKQILVRKDGSLKTGRVTGLICLAFLAVAVVGFEVGGPLQDQVVLVKHQFKPETKKENPPKAKTEPKIVPTEKKTALTVPAAKEVNKTQVQEEAGGKTDRAKKKVMEEFVAMADIPASPKVKSLRLADTDRLEKVLAAGLAQVKETEPTPAMVGAQELAEELNSKNFLALMQSWRTAGSASDGVKKMSLEIQGLLEMYPLLQMKPVAVVGTSFFDLASGSQIDKVSLADYSSTVFAVTDARQKFNNQLAGLGLLDQPGLEVRYYMYDFIRNSIYARAYEAYDWCLEQGLIAEDTSLADVEVRGGAFQINQQGGGRFAVFIPQQLTTAKGVVAKIDPACFADQADVNFLNRKGAL